MQTYWTGIIELALYPLQMKTYVMILFPIFKSIPSFCEKVNTYLASCNKNKSTIIKISPSVISSSLNWSQIECSRPRAHFIYIGAKIHRICILDKGKKLTKLIVQYWFRMHDAYCRKKYYTHSINIKQEHLSPSRCRYFKNFSKH
jgi:hypothetical protein